LDKTEYQAVATNTQAMIKAITSVVLILAGFSIVGAISGYTLSFVGSAFVALPILWLLFRRNKGRSKSNGFQKNMRMLFKYGSPLYICVLLVGFFPFLRNVTLALFVSNTDIGNYKAAVNFAALLIVLAEPITTILLPAFSKLNHASNNRIQYFFQIALKYTTMIIIPVASLIIVFSNEIVQIIYGSTYELAPLFLSTYILLYLLAGIGYLTLPSLYNGLGETKTTLKMNLITFFSLIILAVPLTQAYGVQGVITAFIISLAAGTFYGAYTARKKYSIEFDVRNVAKIYLISAFASVFPILLVNFAGFNNLVNLVLGSVIYLFVFITLVPMTNTISLVELQKIDLAVQNTPLLKQIANPIIKYQQKIHKLGNK
jgi:O-antigen/teichoic acid export membrane protein